MPSYTDLKILLMDNGTEDTTWGTETNANWDAITAAVAGTATVTFSSADVTLTLTNSNSAQDARNMRLVCTGTSGGARNLNLPTPLKFYVIQNDLADTLTVKTVAGTGIAVPAGGRALVYCNGTDIINGISHFSSLSAVSPSFTGTPTAPTAAPGTNTTQIATTAFVTAAATAVIPAGIITMWSGTIATIPSGWALCNGSNGTPDLRDRFIVGASQDDAGVAKTNITGSLTQTGGSKDAIVVSHTHTATTTITDPGHTHNITSSMIGDSGGTGEFTGVNGSPGGTIRSDRVLSKTTGITAASTINSSGSSGTNANLPPYYALAYIMKT